jgi:hypothetical protein
VMTVEPGMTVIVTGRQTVQPAAPGAQ